MERWWVDVAPEPVPVSGAAARAVVGNRLAQGRTTTWLHSDRGRLLALVSNGTRAMLVLLDGPEDAGEHATSPGAQGTSGGYVLDGGQVDVYADVDTVPLQQALDDLESVVERGVGLPGTTWVVDR